jgi:hypothetical protein
VRKHDDTVFRHVQVGFDGVRPDFYGGFEGRHGVFWEGGFVASMRDRLGYSSSIGILLCKAKTSCDIVSTSQSLVFSWKTNGKEWLSSLRVEVSGPP